MGKRRREDEEYGNCSTNKKARPTCPIRDRLSRLSDEVLLRILSFLPIVDLNSCQRLSRKYTRIAGDSQLWKALYYNKFVRPRASRLPGIREAAAVTADGMLTTPTRTTMHTDHRLTYSSKLSKWLDDENLVKRGTDTNWKRQYKLRHNWTQGACDVDEIQVAEQPPLPPLLVRMLDGIVYTVDSVGGLRAWSSKKPLRGLLAKAELPKLNSSFSSSPPTALAIDTSAASSSDHEAANPKIVIGFENGSFAIYIFDRRKSHLQLTYQHSSSSNGMLSAVALCSPYVITMTALQLLSLYQFSDIEDGSPPRLLHSLRSHTTWPPLSLAIRSSAQSIVATIAYAIPTFAEGWSVGVQEMWLAPEGGHLLDSRLATSISENSRGVSASLPTLALSASPSRLGSTHPSSFAAATPGYSKPTSLSYSHPYLLLSHPDNTLTLYMVTSTAHSLSIGPGRRLWGHTSSVSGAHVGIRGKAVSVSKRGDELRIWELEGSANRRRGAAGAELSVRVQAPALQNQSASCGSVADLTNAIARRGDGLGLTCERTTVGMDDMNVVRGWVGFDEENVVILKERGAGSQALVVYDFT